MNIFYLDVNARTAAQYHADKHVIKMILESIQLLSTAHRLLDGKPVQHGRKKFWLLEGERTLNDETGKIVLDSQWAKCYKQTHVNHPCAIWVRQSSWHYIWLYRLTEELVREHVFRFKPKRLHKAWLLHGDFLAMPPKNIPDAGFTKPPQAMPDDCKDADAVEAYRKYYITHKQHLASWRVRGAPGWFNVR